MDGNNLVVEGNGRGDFSALASSTPTIKIDSLYIDLNDAFGKSAAKPCEHFSIRGYVAEIQKKDSKTCWPFPAGYVSEDRTCLFPPLHIPKFRWWSCQGCLQDIETHGDSKEIGNVCCNAAEGRNTAANSLRNVHDSEHRVPLYTKQKEGEVDVNVLLGGHENGLVCNANKEILSPSHCEQEFSTCLMGKSGVNDTAHKMSCNGPVDCATDCGGHEVAHTGFAIRNLKSADDDSGEGFQANKLISLDDQHRQTTMYHGTSSVVRIVENASDVNPHSSRQPCQETNECDDPPSETENVSILLANNNQDDNLDYKRTQKVRLLSDFFGETNSKSKVAPSKPMLSASTTVVSPHVPAEYSPKGSQNQNCKRKAPQDEDWRPPPVSSFKNVNKKIRNSKGDPKSAHINSSIASDSLKNVNPQVDSAHFIHPYAGSKSERTSIFGMYASPGMKCQSTKQKIDQNYFPSKMKPKVTHVGHLCSSLVAPKDVLNRDNHRKTGDSIKGNRCEIPAKSSKKKPKLCMKKKMPTVDDAPTARVHWNFETFNEGLIGGKGVACIMGGLHSSLNDSLAEQGSDGSCLSKADHGPGLLMQQQRISKEHQFRRKTMNDKDAGNASSLASMPSHFLSRPRFGDPSAVNVCSRIPLFRGKQAEDVTSFMQQRDLPGSYSNERPVGVPGHSDMAKGSHWTGKQSEQGTPDDIPMEIVELMAKNQYERHCQDAGNNTRNAGGMRDILGVHMNEEWRLLPTVTDKSLPIIKQKSVSFSMDQMNETPAPPVFIPFSQTQEIRSTGIHLPSAGTNGGSPYKCRIDGDTVAPRFSSTGLQASNGMYFGLNTPSHSAPAFLRDMGVLNLNALSPEGQNKDSCYDNDHQTPMGSLDPEGRNKDSCYDNYHQTPMGSSDLYSRETMSAMHLLSLMDAGLQPPKKTSLTQNHCSNGLYGMSPSSEFYSANHPCERSCQCSGAAPSACSGLKSKNFDGASGSNGKSSPQPKPKRGRPRKAVSTKTSSPPRKKRGRPRKQANMVCSSGHAQEPKKFLGGADSVRLPIQCQSSNGTVLPPCSVNRNPAEFSMAIAENVYMIGAEDLKLRKTGPERARKSNGLRFVEVQ